MNRSRVKWGYSLALLLALPLGASGQTRQLPVDVFLDAQAGNVYGVWSDPVSNRILFFDTFGRRAASFGLALPTTVDGTVTIRELDDGRARVSVLVQTRNAACWVVQYGEGFSLPAMYAFGYSPLQVSQGLGSASLGDATEHIVFTMPSGAPMPSYLELRAPATDYVLESIIASINCRGELRSGSGYPNGTPGLARTTQTVLLDTGVPAGCPPEQDSDCAPAEKVEVGPEGIL